MASRRRVGTATLGAFLTRGRTCGGGSLSRHLAARRHGRLWQGHSNDPWRRLDTSALGRSKKFVGILSRFVLVSPSLDTSKTRIWKFNFVVLTITLSGFLPWQQIWWRATWARSLRPQGFRYRRRGRRPSQSQSFFLAVMIRLKVAS